MYAEEVEDRTLYSASAFTSELTSKALRMARVLMRDHTVSPATHVYIRMERATAPLIPSRSASPHFGQYSFPVPQRVGGWVCLGGWLHTEVAHPPEDGHPPQYQPTDSAAAGEWIKLMTTESQVRCLSTGLNLVNRPTSALPGAVLANLYLRRYFHSFWLKSYVPGRL